MPKLMHPINPPTLPKPAGYAHGWEVQGGKTVYIAGQVALDKDGHVVGKGDMVAQFRQVCENLKAVVTARAGQMSDIVKLTIFLTNEANIPGFMQAAGGTLPNPPPAITLLVVKALAMPALLIEIEAIAVD